MQHFEYMYLLSHAKLMSDFAKDAKRRGEEFHVMDNFTALKDGGFAQAHLARLDDEDGPEVLVLRLKGLDQKAADKAAFYFFASDKGEVAKYKQIKPAPVGEIMYFSHSLPKALNEEENKNGSDSYAGTDRNPG